MRTQTVLKTVLLLLAAALLAVAGACSTDSPTEPERPAPTPPGGGGGGATAFNVTVTAEPPTVVAGSDDPVLITVRAVRADNGQPAADGTLATVTAVEGSFEEPDGDNVDTLTLVNGVGQTTYFPPTDEEGTVVVRANVGGSSGQVTLEIEGTATFFVSHVSPATGSPQGGDTVAILGNGFEPPVRVLFGGVNATVVSVSPSRITVRTPPSPGPATTPTTVPVTVTINLNEEEELVDTVIGAFTFTPGGGEVQQPTVFSVSPTTGGNEGGTPVSIIGEGFQAPVQVDFCAGGDCVEAAVQSVSSGRIEVRTPPASGFGSVLRDQNVDLRITNLNSGLTTTRPQSFRYGTEVRIISVSPNRVPYFGGPLVTIFGQGFDGPVAVGLADWAQPTTSVTGTEIVVRTTGIAPGECNDVEGEVSVTNITTGAGGSGAAFTWLVEAFAPVIFAVNPTSGPQAGGNNVTLRGDFLLSPRVTIGNRPAEVLSIAADGSQVVVRAPFLPDQELNEEACDANGDGTLGQRFLPTAVNVTLVNSATSCTTTVTNGYVYNPSNTSCRNDVGPPPETEPQCSDGDDNDGDTFTDFPADPQCADANDNNEAA
jgi:hypothetical protein